MCREGTPPLDMLIDLHSHILPGVDDGAATLDDALAMLEIAQRDGIATIVATPHAAAVTPGAVRDAVAGLRAAARDRGLAIDIRAGSEVRFEADLAERYAASEVLPLADTRWLLMELSLRAAWSPYLAQGIYDLQLAGANVILAHAERYPAVQRDPDILRELIEQGVLIQVNADSVLATGSRSAGQAAATLLKRRMAHLIASDAHDARYRPPALAAAYARAATLAGDDHAAWLRETAACVLRGEPVAAPEPLPAASGGIFGRLLGRRG